ncbi:hypothetical protein SAMN05421686_1094 [Thalassolituus maritimus]|uniref:Uncharacterized protein n=1 Tax=Thalassolituus maritimus TaxID=484498 RepID=A0A1N7P866_9GAMM|nr:hypothetical protein [Thalassolituus maritimus]SIT06784.1 hypothetical protein SAMN05421686_1094 [Thalassolituus maritimus]
MTTVNNLRSKLASFSLTLVIIPLTFMASFVAPIASAEITMQGAMYGKVQTLVIPGSRCYTKGPIDLTSAITKFCSQSRRDDYCVYTVPWPTPEQDPGYGCYKNFQAVYKCSGFQNLKTIDIGGVAYEAANQKVTFDCAPMRVGSVTVTEDKKGSQWFSSNGNKATAWYTVQAKNTYGADFEGSINVSTRVKPVTERADLDKTSNYLTCSGTPKVTTNSKGTGYLGVEYQVTGYPKVVGGLTDPTSAQVTFSLEVNGTPCSGGFRYNRDRYPTEVVRGKFFLVVNNEEVPLNINFVNPKSATPSLKMTGGQLLSRDRFSSAISAGGKSYFTYGFYYLNEYGLPTSAGVTCNFGKTRDIAFTTDSDGRLEITGDLTVTRATEDGKAKSDENGKAIWSAETSLKEGVEAFYLQRGQPIGEVTCSVDGTDAKYTQNLGNW